MCEGEAIVKGVRETLLPPSHLFSLSEVSEHLLLVRLEGETGWRKKETVKSGETHMRETEQREEIKRLFD